MNGTLRCLLSLFLLLNSTVVAAQADVGLTPDCRGTFDLCGYVDSESGQVIIEHQYQRAFRFSQGRAAVRIDGLFGYINASGDILVQPQYDLAGPFAFNRAEVVVGNQVGVIDENGQFVIEPMFARARPISPDAVVAVEGEWRFRRWGQPTLDDINPYSWRFGNQEYPGIFHALDGWLVEPDSGNDFEMYDPDGRGLVWASLSERNGWPNFGLFDLAKREWHLEPSYKSVFRMEDDWTMAERYHSTRVNPVSDFINARGEVFLQVPYSGFQRRENGWFRVNNNDGVGLIGRDGSLYGGRLFDTITQPTNDHGPVVRLGADWFSVSLGNQLQAVPKPDWLNQPRLNVDRQPVPDHPLSCVGGLQIFGVRNSYNERRYGMKSADGQVLIEPLYSAIDCFAEGVAWAAIESDRLWCPIGPDGTRRPKPDCQVSYYPRSPSVTGISHHGPEWLSQDRFMSSMQWMRQFLAYGEDSSAAPPLVVGDGVQGSERWEIRGRNWTPF